MRTDVRRFCGVVFSLLCPISAGCIGLAGFDTAVVGTLLGEGDFSAPTPGGNVVISYTNRTSHPAAWTATWQTPDADQPIVFTARTEPNGTSSVSVEGPVDRIALGGLGTDAPAVVLDSESDDPKLIRHEAKPLVCPEDFHPGDIVSFTLIESESGVWTITTEIISGG